MGSSPLARGLLGVPFGLGWSWGIIPARAGFTGLSNLMRPCRKDHPRSRGVYLGVPFGLGWSWGIIPARAGFTDWVGFPFLPIPDHPRSRGVYRGG